MSAETKSFSIPFFLKQDSLPGEIQCMYFWKAAYLLAEGEKNPKHFTSTIASCLLAQMLRPHLSLKSEAMPTVSPLLQEGHHNSAKSHLTDPDSWQAE